MIRFLDGPAKNVNLQLSRAPFILRVVRQGNNWDALDQPSDMAKAGEEIVVYRLASKPSMCHVSRSPRELSGWLAIAEYAVLPEQPPDSTVRTNYDFAAWCDANRERLIAGTWKENEARP